MAWRPHRYLIEGELDNSRPGIITGWMRFVGVKGNVTFDLEGDFHRDIRGGKIHFIGDAYGRHTVAGATQCMRGFLPHQTGKAGDITAGLPPHDYGCYPYIEWYSDRNGRVVLELGTTQVEAIVKSGPMDHSVRSPQTAESVGNRRPVKGGVKVQRLAGQNCDTPDLPTPPETGCQFVSIHMSYALPEADGFGSGEWSSSLLV
jgi:hypothetical protein